MRQKKVRIFGNNVTVIVAVLALVIVLFNIKPAAFSAPEKAMISVSHTTKTPLVNKPPDQTPRPSGEVLEKFFRGHPHEELRTNLTELLANGTIFIGWQDMDASAAFGLAQDDRSELVPVLILTPDLFIPKNRVRAQLIILHEYEHYKQWREGTIETGTFLLRKIPEGDHDQLCKKKWHAERLAYQKECEFGRSHGLLEQLDQREGLSHLCHATEQVFESTLVYLLTRADPMSGVCSETWSTL